MNRIGRERGFAATSRAEFDRKMLPEGAYIVGSPAQVIEKILLQHEKFGHQRTLFQLAIGSVSHADVMRAIELLGTEVAPVIRAELGSGLRLPDAKAAS
jgi:alkanesulfonate monooxygenase SsuD/methylene tetrahydromethanopterin reductase-like flavin-dependent oxidoreductase (luciferase family)